MGRFLLGILSSCSSSFHNHIVVDIHDHAAESKRDWFESVENLNFYTSEFSNPKDRIAEIRSLNADIAVDLSGWTSGHFMRGFNARLAATQVSYLGYFASTGIPNMDFWLGDSSLFPPTMKEWHSERIWRLPRCFIAWNPPHQLPESRVHVPSSSLNHNDGIHFGSFNHHRKLTDQTLVVWGKLLDLLPDSFLVLKSGHTDDHSTSLLLRRRMVRAGLDPSRVKWLPGHQV